MCIFAVTPLAGVWIEISPQNFDMCTEKVTPLAGVWIEILKYWEFLSIVLSLPLRECGLKFPLALVMHQRFSRHSPCGSVD